MEKVGPFIFPLLRSGLFILIGLIFAMATNQSLEQASRWWPSICIVCNIITIALLMIVFKREGITYREIIGYEKGQGNRKDTVAIALAMLSLGAVGMYGFGFLLYGYMPETMVQPIPVWLACINLLLFPLTNVFAELPLYFGYSMEGMEKRTGRTRLSIAYITLFYAVQHSFIPLLADWKYILYSFLSVLPLVVPLTLYYARKRKLVPLMVGHAVVDLAVAAQILLASLSPALFVK